VAPTDDVGGRDPEDHAAAQHVSEVKENQSDAPDCFLIAKQLLRFNI
jgi:hypothetical protein